MNGQSSSFDQLFGDILGKGNPDNTPTPKPRIKLSTVDADRFAILVLNKDLRLCKFSSREETAIALREFTVRKRKCRLFAQSSPNPAWVEVEVFS